MFPKTHTKQISVILACSSTSTRFDSLLPHIGRSYVKMFYSSLPDEIILYAKALSVNEVSPGTTEAHLRLAIS